MYLSLRPGSCRPSASAHFYRYRRAEGLATGRVAPATERSGAAWAALTLSVALVLGLVVADTCQAQQTIQVTVLDERGAEINNFRHDELGVPLWDDWTPRIFVRAPDEPFSLTAPSARPLVAVWRPHSYVEAAPRIWVEVIQGAKVVASGYYDAGRIFSVPAPGRYLVRCSTTFQLDNVVVEEQTNSPTLVPPSLSEGRDGRGKYEFSRVERVYLGPFPTYRYFKRYTYPAVSDTITDVSAGESDRAVVIFCTNPDSWARFATPSAATAWRDVADLATNGAAQQLMQEGLSRLFEAADSRMAGFPSTLLGAEVGTVIYTGLSPKDDLDAETLALAGIEAGATYGICVELGISATGGPALIIGTVVMVAVDVGYQLHLAERLKDAAAGAALDDLLASSSAADGSITVRMGNSGAPLRDVRLVTDRNREVTRHDEFGVCAELATGRSAAFGGIPRSWFQTETTIFGVTRPAVSFSIRLLPGRDGELTVFGPFDAIARGTLPQAPAGLRIVR